MVRSRQILVQREVFLDHAGSQHHRANRRKLKQLFQNLPKEENVAYSMKCLCVPESDSDAGTVVDHVRLFRNRPEHRWRYRVHEQILPALKTTGAEIRWTDIVIHHVGYQDALTTRRKLERNLRLLQLDHAEHPDEPFVQDLHALSNGADAQLRIPGRTQLSGHHHVQRGPEHLGDHRGFRNRIGEYPQRDVSRVEVREGVRPGHVGDFDRVFRAIPGELLQEWRRLARTAVRRKMIWTERIRVNPDDALRPRGR